MKYNYLSLLSRATLILLCLGSMLACNCVYDDLSSCQSNKIVFSYLADATKEVLPDYISSIDVYVYNEDGTELLKQMHMEDFKGIPNPELILRLPRAKYRVVAIGNVGDKTKVENTDAFAASKIGEPAGFEKAANLTGNDRLYLVDKVIASEAMGVLQTDTLRFRSAHVRFHYQVTNIPEQAKAKDHPYLIRMRPMSPLVQMDGKVQMSDRRLMTLLPDKGSYLGETVFQGDINSLRFENSNDIQLQLFTADGATLLCEASLAKFLHDYKIEVSAKNEVDIYIRFYFKGLRVTVAPWEAVDTKPVTE